MIGLTRHPVANPGHSTAPRPCRLPPAALLCCGPNRSRHCANKPSTNARLPITAPSPRGGPLRVAPTPHPPALSPFPFSPPAPQARRAHRPSPAFAPRPLPTKASGSPAPTRSRGPCHGQAPKVLLIDEPFGALDAKVRKALRRWLRQFHDGVGLTNLFLSPMTRRRPSSLLTR